MSIKGNVHVDENEFLETPSRPGRLRKLNVVKLPAAMIPFNPTHQVTFVFEGVRYRTNVEAVDGTEAQRLALMNLRSTYWPEHRLKELGPVLEVIVREA